MNDISKLKHYIDFLKKEHNLSISFNIDDNSSITKEQMDKLIEPLCNILDLSYAPDITNENSNIIKEVKVYLEKHRSQNITSEDICKDLSCSRSHISHKFKAQTGMSMREYLTKLRINDAKKLLKFSELTITEIAFITGFNSSNYFTNVFKKEVGMSPGAYRKKVLRKKDS